MRLTRTLVLATALVAAAAPAFADATAFIGNTASPSNRAVKGFSIGMSLLIVGFEFEYAHTSEDSAAAAPSLITGMGNVLVQTPFAIHGLQPYLTTGGGVYRESLADAHYMQFGSNFGGGVKVSLLGPIRARVDYRAFKLSGHPLYSTVHRVYAGVNLAF